VKFDVTVPTSGFIASGQATSTLYVGVAPDYKALAGLRRDDQDRLWRQQHLGRCRVGASRDGFIR
jgi:hypothetical protein